LIDPDGLFAFDVVERGVWRLALLDDGVDEAVGRRIVATLEGREVEDDHVGMVSREARRPHLLGAVDRIVLRPDVIELERGLDDALLELLLVVAIEVLAILRDRAHRQDRVAEDLELFRDAVVQAGIGSGTGGRS